jgi:hypothetical protein
MPPLGEIRTNAARVLAALASGEQLPVGETPTDLCLDKFLELGTHDAGGFLSAQEWLAGMARTAAIFQVPDEALEVFASTPPTEIELPPLPYPRMWFDCIDPDGALKPFLRVESTLPRLPEWEEDYEVRPGRMKSDPMDAEWFSVAEVVQGRSWDVAVGWSPKPDDDALTTPNLGRVGGIGLWRLTSPPDGEGLWAYETGDPLNYTDRERGLVGIPPLEPDEAEGGAAAFARACLLNAVHLVTARRVRHRPWPMPRGQRKDLGRHGMAMPPRLYRVDLSEAGDIRRGASDREYHVRWLVRGHWRLAEGGGTYVPHKGGDCTWVRPYVKGPPDAPWKGRPVYTGVAAA